MAEASVETMPRPLVTVSPRAGRAVRRRLPRRATSSTSSRSMHTEWDGDVAAAAERIAAVTGDDVVGIVLALHRFVHTSLQYTPGATYIGVDVNEVLAKAKGVCQDYAHLAVALCRSIGIPARYVSGYFFAASDATGADVDGDEVHGADPRLVRGRHPRLGLAGPRPDQRPAGRAAPHHDRPRARLRRRAAGARHLRRRRSARAPTPSSRSAATPTSSSSARPSSSSSARAARRLGSPIRCTARCSAWRLAVRGCTHGR